MPDRLAIDGGTPVRARLLPYGRQTIDAADEQAVLEALRSEFLTTGPRVEAFEAAFAAQVGAAHAVAFSNGTAALHGAAHAAQLAAGDEAITTPMTFAATANCVRYEGATVVFADVRPDTLEHRPAPRCEGAVTARTRALLPVDYTGAPADLDECLAIAARHGLTVIEDAAHALGATYKGRLVGGIADLTTFSLHPVKHVTTAEGGMVTTNDPALAARLRRFRNHGITADSATRAARGSWFYDIVEVGMNYRLTDLQCALGLSQLKKLPGWLATPPRDCRAGRSRLRRPCPRCERRPYLRIASRRGTCTSSASMPRRCTVDRAAIFAALRAENIGVNVHYIPVHLHTAYDGPSGRGRFPVAEQAYDEMVTLPIWPGMADADIDDVITAVQRVIGAYRR